MAEEADLMSSGGKLTMSAFSADFRGPPVLIRILEIGKDNGYTSGQKEIVPHASFFVVGKVKQKRVSLRTKDGRLLSISLESPKKFQVVFRFALGPPVTLKQIFKRGVRGSGDVTVAMDDDTNDAVLGYPIDYRELKIVSTTEESFLIGHAVTGMTMESRVTPLSCRAEMSLEIVDRHATKTPIEFRQWLDSLSRRSSQLHQNREPADMTSSIPDLVLLTDDLTDSKVPCLADSVDYSCFAPENLRPEKNNCYYGMATPTSELDRPEVQQHGKTAEVRKSKTRTETKIEHPVPAASPGPSKSTSQPIYKEKLIRRSEVRPTREERKTKTLGIADVIMHSRSFSDGNFGGSRSRCTTDPGEVGECGDKVTRLKLHGRSFGMSVRSPIGRWGKSGKTVEKKEAPNIPRSKSHDDLIEVSKKRLEVGTRATLGARIMQSFRDKTLSRRVRLERSVARNLESVSSISSDDDDDDDDEDGDDYEKITVTPPVEETVRTLHSIRMALTEGKTFIADSFFKRSNFPKVRNPGPPVAPRPLPPEKSKFANDPEYLVRKNRQVRHDYLEVIISSDHEEDEEDDEEGDLRTNTNTTTLPDESGSARNSICSTSTATWKAAGKEWRLAKNASEIPADLDVAALTVREVGHCLRLLNMTSYVKRFKRRMVDGAILVTLTEKMLADSFGMDRLDARKIVMFSKDKWRPSFR